MWLNLLITLWPMTGIGSTPTNDLGIEIGQKWSQLDYNTQTLLRDSKHWNVDNRKYFGNVEAPNTDNCFFITNDCQLDWEHHVFRVENSNVKGEYFIVTFSYNYRVLRVEDTNNHQG